MFTRWNDGTAVAVRRGRRGVGNSWTARVGVCRSLEIFRSGVRVETRVDVSRNELQKCRSIDRRKYTRTTHNYKTGAVTFRRWNHVVADRKDGAGRPGPLSFGFVCLTEAEAAGILRREGVADLYAAAIPGRRAAAAAALGPGRGDRAAFYSLCA